MDLKKSSGRGIPFSSQTKEVIHKLYKYFETEINNDLSSVTTPTQLVSKCIGISQNSVRKIVAEGKEFPEGQILFSSPKTTRCRKPKGSMPVASTSTSNLQQTEHESLKQVEHVVVKEEAVEDDSEPIDDPSWFEATDNFKTELPDDQALSDHSGSLTIAIPEAAANSNSIGVAVKRPRPGSFRGSQIPVEQEELKETEFDMFGRSIGTQLNNMPIRDALELQLALQKVITDFRLSKCAR